MFNSASDYSQVAYSSFRYACFTSPSQLLSCFAVIVCVNIEYYHDFGADCCSVLLHIRLLNWNGMSLFSG